MTDALADYEYTRNEHVGPMYEPTGQLGMLAPTERGDGAVLRAPRRRSTARTAIRRRVRREPRSATRSEELRPDLAGFDTHTVTLVHPFL